MNKFLLCATFGLCLLPLCLAETQFNISCRYAGVFHVEKNRRYSLTRSEAVELCRALNSTLPTMEQMEKAHSLGFETCRYGYIEDKIVLPRINPYHQCAANSTGIYILASNGSERYDTYCYNASETREKACEPIIKLDASWAHNESQIVIDNADGSRYTGGVRETVPTPVTDDNTLDIGSTHDKGATDPTIIRTLLPGTKDYEETSPDAVSTDYFGSGRKEYHPTSTNDITKHLEDKITEDSTKISPLPDDVPGEDNDVKHGQHPTSTTIIRADEDSLHGAHHENTTQGQEIPGFIPLQRDSTHHKEEYPTTVIKDVDSQANTTDDEDFRQSLLNHGILLEGDNNETREEHPTSTFVDPHHDTRHETTSQEKPFFFPWWHFGNSNEQHPTTSSNDVNSHDDGTDDEDSIEEPLKPTVLPGWDINDVRKEYPPSTNMSSHDDRTDDEDSTQDPLIPVISLGGEHSGDKEQHPPSTNEDSQDYGVDDEDSAEDPLHSGTFPGWDKNDDKEQHPPMTNVDSHGYPKRIETTQDPLLHNVYLGGDKDENKYPTNTSVDSMKPALFPTMERDHSSSSVTVNNEIGRNTYTPTAVVVSNEGAKDEDPTQDPLLNGVYPGRSNKVEYSTNATRDDMLPGVIPSPENEHSTTAVTANDGATYEDSSHDLLLPDNQPGWDSEDKYHTNTSRDYTLHELGPPNENEYESYTAVFSSNGATLEDSTQDPLLHSVHPRWGNEDKYLTNTSGDDDLPGIIPPSETEHKNDSSHTAVVSNDGAKHEDSTKDPLATGMQPGRDKEVKYPTNNTRDNMIPGVFSDIESGHGREPASTANSFPINSRDGRKGQPGQTTKSQPRSAQIPEWLIIVASLLALTLILAVCIAVNSRRRCGQKRKLVINNGKGSVSDKKMGGLNGEASKSQEMVHLVHKEQPNNQTGSCDEFLTTDETQNQKEADMKTGI